MTRKGEGGTHSFPYLPLSVNGVGVAGSDLSDACTWACTRACHPVQACIPLAIIERKSICGKQSELKWLRPADAS